MRQKNWENVKKIVEIFIELHKSSLASVLKKMIATLYRGKNMIIGCPKEVKLFENRVALTPPAVNSLTNLGCKVLVQQGAGLGSFISDEDYRKNGAEIVENAHALWARSDIITKVKEPLAEEFGYFREGQIIYTFLHLAAEPELSEALLEKKVTGIAYETIEENGHLPLLKPMSEVAGRMATQVGAWSLQNLHGGKGILLSGVPGVRKGRVVILGAGVVGKNAAKIALGMGAQVTMLDISPARLEEIDDLFLGQVQTIYSSENSIISQISRADLVIGAVLLAGARAPRLISREMLKEMEKGTVLVDVAVDQGGCMETVRRTTHENPTYMLDGIVHYGVANMPGAVATTSTYALSQVTLPYLLKIAREGLMDAIKNNSSLLKGVNTFKGKVTQSGVATALGKEYFEPLKILL